MLVDPRYRKALRAAGGGILPYVTRWAYWRLDDAALARPAPLPDDDLLSSAREAKSGSVRSRPEVAKAFARLSPRDRDILRWRYEESCTNETVAARLSISHGAAKKAAHDARERLRVLLAEEGFLLQ
jgi:RNA polymerase sigma factor (sigma-70 family)